LEKNFELELKAQENIIIAKKEKIFSSELKKLAKNLLKKVKMRKKFVAREMALAQARVNLVEANKDVLQNKIKNKETLDFSDEIIKNEKDFIEYHEELANKQLENAKNHESIAQLEKELAKHKISSAKLRYNAATIRIKLGKYQLKYLKALESKTSQEKKMIILANFREMIKSLEHSVNEISEKEKIIKEIQQEIQKKSHNS